MLSPAQNKFLKVIGKLGPSRRPSEVFDDFCAASYYAIHNNFYALGRDEEIESEYLNIMARHSDYPKVLPELFATAFGALSDSKHDFLGGLYMELGSDSSAGQFFTPYTLSKFIAEITFSAFDAEKAITERGCFTVSEPSCGSGGMIIAMFDKYTSAGFPSHNLYVEARDVSRLCCYMTYVQLAMLDIPAKIICGNTLTMEERFTLQTPYMRLILKHIENEQPKVRVRKKPSNLIT